MYLNTKKEPDVPHLLLLLVTCSLSCLGTVDRFGLGAVDEVQQLINVAVVDGSSHRQLRVLTLR